MKKSILVTGVSGTGKSALSNKLKEKGYAAYDLEEVKGLFAMYNKQTKEVMHKWNNDDPEVVKNMDWICDVEKLKSLIENEKSEIAFYCSAASNIEEIIPLFTSVVLLTADEKTIRERLSTRTSNDFGRTKEVQDMVIGWKDWWEEEVREKGGIMVDSSKDLGEVADEVIALFAQR